MEHKTSTYRFENFQISDLTYPFILKHSSGFVNTQLPGFFDIQPIAIEVNSGVFTSPSSHPAFPEVSVELQTDTLLISCNCQLPKKKLCEHQIRVLFNIMDRPPLLIFFDEPLRLEKLKTVAKEYGLENEGNLDALFDVFYKRQSVDIKPKVKGLFAVNESTTGYLTQHLLDKPGLQLPKAKRKEESPVILVFSKHKYYGHLVVELFEASIGKDGQLKNPLKFINPLDQVWDVTEPDTLKFYTAISKFQNTYTGATSSDELPGLKALVKNPLSLSVFYHNPKVSESIKANSLVPVHLQTLLPELSISVDLKENFHEVTAHLTLQDKPYDLKNLTILFDHFILMDETLYFIDQPQLLKVIGFFKQNNHTLLIHSSKFEAFQESILQKLETKIRVSYSYVKPATPNQIKEKAFDTGHKKLLYLTEQESFIILTPVMTYGPVEVPVLSKKQVYSFDQNGNTFMVERDEDAEISLTSQVMRQHVDFEEQLSQGAFYLHKEKFMEEGWFLDAFEAWSQQQISVLGFNQLTNNRLNGHKAKIVIRVSSGIDWFASNINVSFGKQTASLKQLQLAVKNKQKYVFLDDGTMGILPEAWMERFAAYFNSGTLSDGMIKTPKSHFQAITDLYEREHLDNDVKEQIASYQKSLGQFESIKETVVPEGLQATLRDYQKQGLNWLNFLDEFGFGGCLADDMGLGKTIQIIAFILLQKEKNPGTHLVVVPTTLIFNWEQEVKKFAPSLKLYTTHGAKRIKDTTVFKEYDLILTTYGMLLSDIRYLKDFHFHYIFMDESQAIKNPESQRYKAACLLKARNRIVLTGTPIENNTFDLYGQLSFACPGLLGTKKQFKDLYSTPIDKFGSRKRAVELQKKINPFILRRTKKQVATELPEKTEMVIYCEMGAEQRQVYTAYEKELRDYLELATEDDQPKDPMHVLKGITKLRQICNSPALLNDEEFYGEASSKIETLMEQIENKSTQHKILVFSQFVSMLDLIKKELQLRNIPFEYLTGQSKNRAEKVNQFQNNTEVRVFLISLKAGGTGLNLTEADYVYLVDPWWNPAVENQAIDRSYRIGQKKQVMAVRLICPGTIEEKIRLLQDSKKELANDLIKTDVSILKSLSKKELMGLFN